MPRKCSACSHPQRGDIDAAVVADQEPLRAIAGRYGLSYSALQRHKAEHLAEGLARGAEIVQAKRAGITAMIAAKAAERAESDAAVTDARNIQVYEALGLAFARIGKLFDACDRFLTDPANPSEYTLAPRAHELEVVHQVVVGKRGDGTAIVENQKHLLSELLASSPETLRADDVVSVKWRQADPRQLVLGAARRLEAQQRWLADLLVKMQDHEAQDVARSPEWGVLREKIAAAVEGCERCTARVVSVLSSAPS